MNKRNISPQAIPDEATQVAVVKVTTRSWMPAPAFPLAALDPAHWVDRKRQASIWRLLEQLNLHKTLH
jgi:hypothetical protein